MVRAKSSSRFTGSHIYGSTGSEPPNPWIPSAMAMAMSIYRTLCVLVFFLLKISLLEMSLANRFKNLYRGQLFNFCLLKISLLEMLIAFGNKHCFWWFKNLYRGQLFNFWSSSAFFPLKISLLEMLIAFGDSKTFTEGNFSTSGPPLFSSKFHFLRCSLIPPLPSFTGSTIFTSSHCKQAMLGFVSTSLALSC